MKHFKNILSLNLKQEAELNKGKAIVKSPRKHQQEAHKMLSDFFRNPKRGILVLPTGGGKTYTAVYWLLKNVISKNKKVLWLADQGFLLEQAREEFRENILEISQDKRESINIRLVSGSDRHGNPNQIEISDDILLITAQTAISNWDTDMNTKLKQFINHHGKNDDLFIVYDEAHHTPAFGRRNLLIGGSNGKVGIIEKFPTTPLLGLTATPTYTDKNQRNWLWEIFCDRIIYEITKKELEDVKVLANPIFRQENTNIDFPLSDGDVEKMTFKHQEIPAHIIEELANNDVRNRFIAKHYWDNRNEFGKTIIFLDRWYQCKIIERYLNEQAGHTIAASVFSYVDSNKNIDYINNRTANENEKNLEKFKKGELSVLINVKMLTEGVDVPDVNTVFITRDTNSTILFTQMIGRALRGRLAGGNKDTANIILFTDNWSRHIHFASNRFLGGKETTELKERGYRPFELIRIDLLDKLAFEYQQKDYKTNFVDLLPNGWFEVCYTDAFEETIEGEEAQKTVESFRENVVVLASEERIFKQYITQYLANFEGIQNEIWEKEELNLEKAEEIIMDYLSANNAYFDKVTISKLIQIARHLGQNNTDPNYFTFEQKKEVDIRQYVLDIRRGNYGRDEAEDYLNNVYSNSENPFLKVLFPSFEDFYEAYNYEDNVYRKQKKGNVNISEASQEIKVRRLAPEEVRKIVFSRDNHKCLCCGKSNNLQADHIIAVKESEPKDDMPELYQTLCGICNREKSSYSYNYRITNFSLNQHELSDVSTNDTEDPIYYFTRLINCYYKTSAVQYDEVEAKHNGNAVWKAKVKVGAKPEENIMLVKEELKKFIMDKGYKLKDIRITEF